MSKAPNNVGVNALVHLVTSPIASFEGFGAVADSSSSETYAGDPRQVSFSPAAKA